MIRVNNSLVHCVWPASSWPRDSLSCMSLDESEKEKETEINTDPVHLDFSNNCETITDSEDYTTEE